MRPKTTGVAPSTVTRYSGRIVENISDEMSVSRLVIPSRTTVRRTPGARVRESYAVLAPLGRLVVFGVSDAVPGTRRSLWRAARLLLQMPAFRPLALMNQNRGVFGLNLGRLWTEAAKLERIMALLIGELNTGHLHPIIARTFPLTDAAAAHQFLHDRRNIGKVVLTAA